jgi:hypothetical protein
MAIGQKTGGRQKGTVNKKTLAKLVAEVQSAQPGRAPFTGDAYEFMVMTYQDETLPHAVRFAAANAAIKYEKSAKPEEVDVKVQLLPDAVLMERIERHRRATALAAPKGRVIEAEYAAEEGDDRGAEA